MKNAADRRRDQHRERDRPAAASQPHHRHVRDLELVERRQPARIRQAQHHPDRAAVADGERGQLARRADRPRRRPRRAPAARAATRRPESATPRARPHPLGVRLRLVAGDVLEQPPLPVAAVGLSQTPIEPRTRARSARRRSPPSRSRARDRTTTATRSPPRRSAPPARGPGRGRCRSAACRASPETAVAHGCRRSRRASPRARHPRDPPRDIRSRGLPQARRHASLDRSRRSLT